MSGLACAFKTPKKSFLHSLFLFSFPHFLFLISFSPRIVLFPFARIPCEGTFTLLIAAVPLGHRAYDVGTSAYHAIIREFGEKVVAADKTIDRRVLGSMVFGEANKANMTKLTYSLELFLNVSPCRTSPLTPHELF